MSGSLDRALDALDRGLDLAAAPGDDGSEVYAPYGTDDLDLCWRCTAAPPTTDVGLCIGCRDALRDETTSGRLSLRTDLIDETALERFAAAASAFAASLERVGTAFQAVGLQGRLLADLADIRRMRVELTALGLHPDSVTELWSIAQEEAATSMTRSAVDAFRALYDRVCPALAAGVPPPWVEDHRGVRHPLRFRPTLIAPRQ